MPTTRSATGNKSRSLSPALTALLIQFASAIFVFATLWLLWRAVDWRASPFQIVFYHATLVLILTRHGNLAWWWCVIGPMFPIAVVLALLLPVPSWLYLLLFLFFLVFYWSTYRTQVPYYPSTKKVWLEVERLLPADNAFSFVDIGSGLGGLVLYLQSRFRAGSFLGVEIAPLPWLVSFVRAKLKIGGTTDNVQFLRANYETLDFSQFDVIFAYLSPAVMNALWEKAKKEMRPGTILMSYEFPIVGVEPELSINVVNQSGDDQNAMVSGNMKNRSPDHRKLYIWTL